MSQSTSRISTGALERTRGTTLSLGLLAVLVLFLGSGAISYINTTSLYGGAELVTHTHEVITALDDIISLVKDAETGQRGFVITGEEKYLTPYTVALPRIEERLSEVRELTSDMPRQQKRISVLRSRIDTKIQELALTISIRRDQGFDAARAIVANDSGKIAMDAIRDQVGEMHREVAELRRKRLVEMDEAYHRAVVSGILSCLVGFLLSGAVAYLVRRAIIVRRRQEWLQSGQIGLSKAMSGDPRMDQLGESVLKYLAEYLEAHAGAFYVREGDRFQRVATYGVPSKDGTPVEFTTDDRLVGQAAKDGRSFIVHEVPDNYLTFGSALGSGKPRNLAIVPVKGDGVVNALFELGFVRTIDNSMTEFFASVSETIGTAVRSATYRSNLQNFLEETQRQSEELQAQGEELRVSNEELEEQSRALKESQNRLELQQAELEQTNSQLEEQTQLLEAQRDDVTRAKGDLQLQARELERASQYKSDFLANMSHELRTPLNSSLILAKLLSDNRTGNLSEEQVEYAKTIQAAGNDLLNLINDILDLSKIEAGHMQMRPDSMRISQFVENMARTFRPLAEQKNIALRMEALPACPEVMYTDRQRLEQVLKNLLSNAIKFTEKGEVALEIGRSEGGKVAFVVRDTGIGIPQHQQEMVFEAFRQADGTTNRKYGGTGLGLSIARELTRLLGGEIHLTSEAGRGSTFTVTLPEVYDDALVRAQVQPTASLTSTEESVQAATYSTPAQPKFVRRVEDDREILTGDRRTILVVEDDDTFSRIIYDLAHELDFHCLIAGSAEEGLALAAQHKPGAIILDVGLPDNSGLSVLDRLKQDMRTRHIPVHVVSAHDYAQTAMSLGAIGYMLKPVKREQLVQALENLETRLDQRLRRVLIVEDDPVQLESLQKLLNLHQVRTVGAVNAAECLEKLKSESFDCMVLDLSLPDASGYSLLETLSREDAYSFPPVIVYTGRELSSNEEERLRRYSKSIIIKGAKSPDRLLDEVTLFLHQMVSELPPEQQRMLERARSRDAALEGRRILIVEDDIRNVFALTSILEPRGAIVHIARNGKEALSFLEKTLADSSQAIDLVLMDIMMPEMDGITATREIRKRDVWRKLPIIALTAKAMRNDQEQCLSAGANDYMAKPLDVEKLLSLVRVWMPR